jgi:hypothetical protein
LLIDRGALRGDIVTGILRQEALRHQRLLAFEQAVLLRRQGFEAAHLGLVGAIGQRHVAGIDDGEKLALLDALSGASQNLHDAARHFGAELGVGQHFERAQRFFDHLEFAAADLGHCDQRRRRPRLLFLDLLAAGGEQEQDETGGECLLHHGRTDSSANSSAMLSRRRIRCACAPSTMTSAARGRLL